MKSLGDAHATSGQTAIISSGISVIAANKLWLLLLIVIPLYLTWTFDHSLWNPDETRDGGIAAEMYRSGNFAVPKLNGEAFLEKPPLYYWTCAIIYKLTGKVTAGTTRLPSALFGILGVLFTFLIGRRLFNEQVGFMAGCMVATSLQYFRMSHFAMMDVSLAALVASALFFHLSGSKFGFAVLTVLAFYAKGFLGVILPGLVVTIDLATQKRFRELMKTVLIGALVFAVLVFPWFWALWKEGGSDYLKIFVIDNHWKRFFSQGADHTEHFWFFYFGSFPADFMPWTLFFLGFLWDFLKRPMKYLDSQSTRFTLVWFLSLLAFFCLSSSKRSIYLLPLFPSAGILSAHWVNERFSKAGPRIVYWLFGILVFAITISSVPVARRLDRDKTFVPLCDVIRENLRERELVGFDMSEMERGVFGFYLNGPFRNLKSSDDLRRLVKEKSSKGFLLIVNRNKIEDVEPVIAEMRLLFEYRPNKETRSYLLYERRFEEKI